MFKKLTGWFRPRQTRPTPTKPDLEVTTHSVHRQCLTTFTKLMELYQKDPSNINYVIKVTLPSARVYDCLSYLSRWIELTRHDKSVPQTMLMYRTHHKSLDDFFTSESNTYLNTDACFTDFCNGVILYCETFLSIDDSLSNQRYNKRVSTNLTNVLLQAAITLLESR